MIDVHSLTALLELHVDANSLILIDVNQKLDIIYFIKEVLQ